MNEVRTMDKKTLSQELFNIMVESNTPEKNVSIVRAIMRNKNMCPHDKMEMAYNYIGFVLEKEKPKTATEIIATRSIKPVKRYTRVPFEKKMNMIEMYLNEKESISYISKKLEVPYSTVYNIISNYRNAHPEMFVEIQTEK